MKSTIWKYEIPYLKSVFTIRLPKGATIVHVASVFDTPFLWVMFDPRKSDDENETRTFTVYGTGHDIEDDTEYVGTFFVGAFVWHLFEVTA